jgi:exodeoxyribonuclease V alpha subunit
VGASEVLHDFYIIREEDPVRALTLLKTVVSERIPRRFDLDPLTAVQVISPTHRGPLGVAHLNEQLQELLNPSRGAFSELELGHNSRGGTPEVSGRRLFRVGDRVMQLRNNYDKNVFNGDMGRVAAIDRENQIVRVDYPAEGAVASAQAGTIPGVMREPFAAYRPRRRSGPSAPLATSAATSRHSSPLGPVAEATYDFGELEELTLAYAVSAHKAQGSEFPAVVVLLAMSHYMMLQRNLLYTAITRARQLCVVICSPRALQRAVENNAVAARYSALAQRLQALPSGAALARSAKQNPSGVLPAGGRPSGPQLNVD